MKYTSIPPALVFPRALRAKHFFLALIALVALTANFLTVALSGLFKPATRQFSFPQNYTQAYAARIMGIPTLFTNEQWIVTGKIITENAPLLPWVAPDYYFLPFEPAQGTANTTRRANTRGFGSVLDCYSLGDPVLKPKSDTIEANSSMPVYTCFRPTNVNFTIPARGGRDERFCGRAINEKFVGQAAAGEPSKARCTWWNEPDPVELYSEVPATAEFSANYDYTGGGYERGAGSPFKNVTNDPCEGIFTVGWARANFIANETFPETLVGTNTTKIRTSWEMVPESPKYIELVCQLTFATALFDVTVDGDGRVREFHRTSELETDVRPYLRTDLGLTLDNLTSQADRLSFMDFPLESRLNLHNNVTDDNTPLRSFLTLALDKLSKSDSFSNPKKQLPSVSTAADSLDKLYKLIFAVTCALYADKIFEPHDNESATIAGAQFTEERRVFIDQGMFTIAMMVLGMNVVVGFVLYFRRPPKLLPRLPTTLASEIAFFYGSQALEDLSGAERMSTAARGEHLEKKGHKYGYGWYVGQDRKLRKGVERQTLLLKDGQVLTNVQGLPSRS